MDLTPGLQLGTYRVIRLLGKGGMGAVYEVEHAQLGGACGIYESLRQ